MGEEGRILFISGSAHMGWEEIKGVFWIFDLGWFGL